MVVVVVVVVVIAGYVAWGGWLAWLGWLRAYLRGMKTPTHHVPSGGAGSRSRSKTFGRSAGSLNSF